METSQEDLIPIPPRAESITGETKYVTIALSEIVRIKNELAKVRHYAPSILTLHEQVGHLVDKLERQWVGGAHG